MAALWRKDSREIRPTSRRSFGYKSQSSKVKMVVVVVISIGVVAEKVVRSGRTWMGF